MLRIDVNY